MVERDIKSLTGHLLHVPHWIEPETEAHVLTRFQTMASWYISQCLTTELYWPGSPNVICKHTPISFFSSLSLSLSLFIKCWNLQIVSHRMASSCISYRNHPHQQHSMLIRHSQNWRRSRKCHVKADVQSEPWGCAQAADVQGPSSGDGHGHTINV